MRMFGAFRLDWHRITGRGNDVAFMLAFFPALTLLMSFSTGTGAMMPGIQGGLVGMFAVLPMNLFVYEDQPAGHWLGDMVPLSRRHQVMGRYVFLLVLLVVIMMELVVCTLIANIASGDAPWSWNDSAKVASLMFGMGAAESLYFPLLYRFPARKAMMVVLAVMFLLVFGGIGLATTLPESVVDGVIEAVSDAMGTVPLAIGLETAVFVLILVLSASVSTRIVEGKEL